MTAVLQTGPQAEPVSVAQVQAHLRLAAGEESLLASLIAAARMTVEQQSGMRLMTQVWHVLLDDWPEGAYTLPVAPVQEVTAVQLPGDKLRQLSPSDYRLTADALSPRIRFIGNHLPRPGLPECGIRIVLKAGFGDTPQAVPEDLSLAVLKLAAYWFDLDDFSQQQSRAVMPPHIAALVNARRLPRL